MTKEFSLKKKFPEFTSELKQLLADYPNLLKQVDDLRIVERCRCGEKSCAMMYSSPPPKGAWGNGHKNYLLNADKGMVILDVLKENIVAIEIFDRNEIQERLVKLLPKKQPTTNN